MSFSVSSCASDSLAVDSHKTEECRFDKDNFYATDKKESNPAMIWNGEEVSGDFYSEGKLVAVSEGIRPCGFKGKETCMMSIGAKYQICKKSNS